MKCPTCAADELRLVIDAYAIYAVSEDGARTMGSPEYELFDERWLECLACGWTTKANNNHPGAHNDRPAPVDPISIHVIA